MADGVSIGGLILAIPPIVEMLVTYYTDVRDAKSEIQRYATDLLSLKGIFEYIQSVQAIKSDDVYKYESSDFLRMVEAAGDALQGLQLVLQHKDSFFGHVMQRVTWTHKKKEAKEHFARLERMKSAFVAVMMGDNLNYNQTILSEISQLKQDMARDRISRESDTTEKEKEVLLSWFAPVGPEPIHSKAYKAHQPDTGTWFLNGPLKAFKEDAQKRARALWVQGKSGSGKTLLLAFATEHLRAEFSTLNSVSLAYFYCSFDTLASQSPVNILASLLAQLSVIIPPLYQELFKTYMPSAQKRLGHPTDTQKLEDMFQRHTEGFEHVFVIVDAINESEEADEVEKMLLDLAKSCKNLRLLISSTSSPKQTWTDFPTVFLEESCMATKTVNEDIRNFVDHRIVENVALHIFSESLRQEIKEVILGLANGVFRYAASQIDHVFNYVNAQLTGRDVRRALADMPTDLNESYERILSQFNSEASRRKCYEKYMRKALLLLCFATRPLRLVELSEAIVVEEDDTGLDSDLRLRDPQILISLGQGLFDYDRATGLITLGHSSIKTFLTSESIRRSSVAKFALDELEAHGTIMRTCITYLRFKCFEIEVGRSIHSYTSLASEYPLLAYAAHSWPLHIRSLDSTCWSQIATLLSTRRMPNGGNYGFWIQYIVGSLSPDVVGETSPLYYAASFGYDTLVSAILLFEKPLNLEQPGGRHGSTALQVACFRQQRKVVELLVEAGANPFSPDGSGLDGGFSSVFWAKSNGWDDLAEWMTKKGKENGFKPRRVHHGRYIREIARNVQGLALEELRSPPDSSRPRWVQQVVPAYLMEEGEARRFLLQKFPELRDQGLHIKAIGDKYEFVIPRLLTEEEHEELRALRS